jgi:hypothetical protein
VGSNWVLLHGGQNACLESTSTIVPRIASAVRKRLKLTSAYRLAVTLLLCSLIHAAQADPATDHFLMGYASAILEQQFKLKAGSLFVKDGVVSIHRADVPLPERDRVEKALQEIKGVTRVEIIETPPDQAPPSRPVDGSAAVQLGATEDKPGEFLPSGRLFDPLIADPRSPHFSVAYQRYTEGNGLENVAAASLGTTIGLYENDFPGAGRWQVGLAGAVFAIFDLDAPSLDLVNADYWVAFPFTYRYKSFSTSLRFYHQSSHLGDEFLLRTMTNRLDISYEGVDLILSLDLFRKVARIYGGGGYLLRRNPSDLERASLQGGLELRSPWTLLGKVMRPIATADVQARQETDWDVDLSVRAGFQFESEKLRDRYLQLMFEYYRGHSPNGQFFEENIEFWGVGIHFYYD